MTDYPFARHNPAAATGPTATQASPMPHTRVVGSPDAPQGEKVTWQLALTDEAGKDALMAALLGEAEWYQEARPSRDGPPG